MPCPFFEPQAVAHDPHNSAARLPLLEEYDGLCHAISERVSVPRELRFRYCNHGYSQGACAAFPASERRASIRYSITRSSQDALQLLLVAEENYAPSSWRSIEYLVGEDAIRPDPDDPCLRAQILAFCRSYLKLFAGQ